MDEHRKDIYECYDGSKLTLEELFEYEKSCYMNHSEGYDDMTFEDWYVNIFLKPRK